MEPKIFFDCIPSTGELLSQWAGVFGAVGTVCALFFMIYQFSRSSKQFTQSSFQVTFFPLLDHLKIEGKSGNTNIPNIVDKFYNVDLVEFNKNNILAYFERKYFKISFSGVKNPNNEFQNFLLDVWKQWDNPYPNTRLALQLIIANEKDIDDQFYLRTILAQFDERNLMTLMIALVCLDLNEKDPNILSYLRKSDILKKLNIGNNRKGAGREMWKIIKSQFNG